MDGIVKQIQELEQIESSVTFQTNQLLKNLTYTPNEDFDPEHYDNLNDLNGNLKAFALNIYKHYHVISGAIAAIERTHGTEEVSPIHNLGEFEASGIIGNNTTIEIVKLVSLGFDKNDKTTTELAKYIIRMRFINLNFNDIIDKTENEVLGLFNKIS